MKKYVLIKKTNKGIKIGLHEYSKEKAEERLKVVNSLGLRLEIMEADVAYGRC